MTSIATAKIDVKALVQNFWFEYYLVYSSQLGPCNYLLFVCTAISMYACVTLCVYVCACVYEYIYAVSTAPNIVMFIIENSNPCQMKYHNCYKYAK